MTKLARIRDLDLCQSSNGGHGFVTAASGLVRLADTLYVIADDAHHLAVFQLDSQAPGQFIRLLPGALPSDAVARKAVKPDFEILLQLPDHDDTPGLRLLALGSGSSAHRMRGAIVALSPDGSEAAVEIIDLKPLFAALAALCPNINLEGATICGDRLLLFNRGNMEAPLTAIFSADLAAILAGCAVDIVLENELQLPNINGVPLTVTDACRLDNGTTLLSAVAEETGDSYADGAILGAAFVVLSEQFEVLRIERIDPTCKIEGITAQQNAQGLSVFCVSDADDPNTPSSLYTATLQL